MIHVIPVSIGNVLLEKSNTTNIVNDIFIAPTEQQKSYAEYNTCSWKSADSANTSLNCEIKSEY